MHDSVHNGHPIRISVELTYRLTQYDPLDLIDFGYAWGMQMPPKNLARQLKGFEDRAQAPLIGNSLRYTSLGIEPSHRELRDIQMSDTVRARQRHGLG